MFRERLWQNMEVYLDDMLVKSQKASDHVKDLEEVFQVISRYKMKSNPTKRSFRVRSGNFLGHMVTQREIEVNP